MKEYDLIVCFGVQEMMKELAVKIKDEMKPNTLIVSCRFPIAAFKSVFNYDDDLDSSWIYNKESLMKQVAVGEKKDKIKLKKKEEKDDEDDD